MNKIITDRQLTQLKNIKVNLKESFIDFRSGTEIKALKKILESIRELTELITKIESNNNGN